MKSKYLMMGAAMLAISSAFVSCSKDKDLYDPTTKQNQLIENYNQAFIQTFGEPAANQTWGFGAPATRTTRSRTFNYYEFPGDADASKFLADVPAGVEPLVSGIGKTNHYLDPSYTGDVNIWGIGSEENGWVAEGGILYVKGNCDFSARDFFFAGHSELYLVEGATLTLKDGDKGAGGLQGGCNIYIAQNAKLLCNGELKLNNGMHVFNHGTIEAPTLSVNSDSWLVNGGTVTVVGKISVENGESVMENNGTITAAELNTAGSGKFENNYNVTISGNTVVNSNNNTWVNNGQYHTGYFFYHAASDEVINNCNLTVDEDFNINLGDNPGDGNFKMGAGSGVVTKNFNGGGNFTNAVYNWINYNGGPFYIYMDSNSLFDVTETATMNATKADYGVYGIGDGYAVFQAKNIVAGKAEQGYEVTYGGKIAVVCESHFEQGWSGQYPYIDFKEGANEDCIYTNGSLPTITIPQNGNCNAGFTGRAGEVLPSLHVMAEDLTAAEKTDFDFNDVVIDVFYVDQNTVNITLLAAGGTLPLRIAEKDAWEVHKLFDVDVKCMVNTGTKYHVAHAPYSQTTKPYVYLTLTGKTWSKDQETFEVQVRDQIKLEVQKEDVVDEFGNPIWTELKAEVGHPACKVATPVEITVEGWYPEELRWAWEKQYVGDGFAQWVINPNYIDWYVTKD